MEESAHDKKEQREAEFMEHTRIRCLVQGEKQNTRPMYERIFEEDSRIFVDYYYKWKTRDNRIFVMEEKNAELKMESAEYDMLRTGLPYQVMLHLNPYKLMLHGKVSATHYIVAVATNPDYRRQGKMQQVMQQALVDMGKEQIPFTFLLPADPAYYEGQGFVFLPNQITVKDQIVSQRKKRGAVRHLQTEGADGIQYTKMQASEAEEIAVFSNQLLEQKYDIYIRRDTDYYIRLLAETAAEHGGVILIESGKKRLGIIVYGMETITGKNGAEEKTAEIKELLLAKEYETQAETLCQNALPDCRIVYSDMRMMVRITNLEILGSLMRSKEPYCRKVRVMDSMLPEHNGCYRIQSDKQGSSIVPVREEDTEQEMEISELTRLLFQDMSVYLNEWV